MVPFSPISPESFTASINKIPDDNKKIKLSEPVRELKNTLVSLPKRRENADNKERAIFYTNNTQKIRLRNKSDVIKGNFCSNNTRCALLANTLMYSMRALLKNPAVSKIVGVQYLILRGLPEKL